MSAPMISGTVDATPPSLAAPETPAGSGEGTAVVGGQGVRDHALPKPLRIVAYGIPGPQGSKSAFVVKGRAVMRESSAKVKPWRESVRLAAWDAIDGETWHPLDGPIGVQMRFYFARPAGHYGTGRNSGSLRAGAPVYPHVKPDLSKLVRSTEDALTIAGIWRDDARVVTLVAVKLYCGSIVSELRTPGAEITVWPVLS